MNTLSTMMAGQRIARASIATAIAAVLLFSCKKNNTGRNNTPAFYISESEKLVIPTPVALPENGIRVATYYAEGVQKYKAQAIPGTNPVLYEWVFVAPEATLYDSTNKKAGTHGAGPSWKLDNGVDSIFGQAFSPAKTAPGTGTNSIDWLQLMPNAAKKPSGIFASVAYIQRIATVGGKKPLTAPDNAAATVDMPYTAIYRFTKKY